MQKEITVRLTAQKRSGSTIARDLVILSFVCTNAVRLADQINDEPAPLAE